MSLKYYDAILPIGESCITSYNLRIRNLQNSAFPFDWLMDFKLDKFVYYLENDFKDFMLQDNLVPYTDIPPTSCEHYRDIKTNILFVHCFSKPFDINNDFYVIRDKFFKRIQRFKFFINKKNVLLVYVSKTDCYDNNQIVEFYNKIKKIYNKQNIDLFYIVNVKECDIYQNEVISQHITKFTISYSNEGYLPGQGPNQTWIGLQLLFDKIFENVRLKNDKILIIRKYTLKLLACFCPIKTLRKRIKNIKVYQNG